jgi:hypothetical protein
MGRWLKTTEDRISTVFAGVLLVWLVVLALMAVDVALGLLAFVGGTLVGMLAAYPVGRLLIASVRTFRFWRLLVVWLLHVALIASFILIRLTADTLDWLRDPGAAFAQALLMGYALPVWFMAPNRAPQGSGRARTIGLVLGLHAGALVTGLALAVLTLVYVNGISTR